MRNFLEVFMFLSGYVFSHWTATNNGTFDDATSADALFTMPAADTVITAHFIMLPRITTLSLDDGEVGKAYSMTLTANGTSPLTWTVSSGTLPAGLTLSSNGIISGTPTESGSIEFAVQVGNSVGSDTRSYWLKVNPKPIPPTIADYTFPHGIVGTAYNRPVIMTAGDTPFTFSVANGSLPDGLTLSSTGYVIGTPTASGIFTFTIKVDNAAGSDSKEYTLVIDPKSVAPTITTASLPNGRVGVTYSQTLAATGDAPISWSAEGNLPDGLALSSGGTISGTPTTAGTSTFTVKASNGVEPDASVQLSITIEAAPVAPTIKTASLPNGRVGVVYSQTLAATGDAPIFWSAEGTLPDGLALSSGGTISGTPTTAGTSIFTVKASNGVVPDAMKQLSITIESASTPPVMPVTIGPSATILAGRAPITNITIGAGVAELSAANFDKLLIDGQLVLPGTDTFDVRTGSIILQMNPSYLNTLALGRHEVRVLLKGKGFEGVDVSTTITVVSAAAGTDVLPKTGDNTPLLFYIVLMSASLTLCLWIVKRKKHLFN